MQTQLGYEPQHEREVSQELSTHSVMLVETSLAPFQLRFGDRSSDNLSYRFLHHPGEPGWDFPFLTTGIGLTFREFRYSRQVLCLIEPGDYSPSDRSGGYDTVCCTENN